ncbi:hypothetical protein DPMN_085011 [Dreissena polymorpha]|uniref:Uncharacterized protein n=1 Tax=Dreissena polymorpha TaxID=45954 RepID=A0A9D4BJX3_DREPO|nr:hypothetical protein DPMN_085011 [Dreissena polymorpha]
MLQNNSFLEVAVQIKRDHCQEPQPAQHPKVKGHCSSHLQNDHLLLLGKPALNKLPIKAHKQYTRSVTFM